MNPVNCIAYRHSGKFGFHVPVITIFAAIPMAFLLGYAYAYLMNWIPFIYLHFLLTAGYGVAFGFAASIVMKLGKVRNNLVVALTGFVVGFIALYFEWNAHIHTLSDEMPWFLMPDEIINVMKWLYEHGSYTLRGSQVTGVQLGLFWVGEAVIIMACAIAIPWSTIHQTPFCEENQCWLDEERKIETLEQVTDPGLINQLRAGDLSVLANLPPKTPGAADFTRITVKHSPSSQVFFTLRVENVTTVRDKNDNESQKVQLIMADHVLPFSMMEFIDKLEKLKQATPSF